MQDSDARAGNTFVNPARPSIPQPRCLSYSFPLVSRHADSGLSLFYEYSHRKSASTGIVDKRQPGGSLDKDGRNVGGSVRNMEPAWLAATTHLDHALFASENGGSRAVVDDCGRRAIGLRLSYLFGEVAQAPLDQRDFTARVSEIRIDVASTSDVHDFPLEGPACGPESESRIPYGSPSGEPTAGARDIRLIHEALRECCWLAAPEGPIQEVEQVRQLSKGEVEDQLTRPESGVGCISDFRNRTSVQCAGLCRG